MFGALRDAGPDYWGRRVIEKYAGKPALGELDYILQSTDDRAGALGFGLGQEPPAPRRNFNKTLELEKLQRIADQLTRDELPERLTALANAVGLPVEECGRLLAGAAWKLTEGLRPLPHPSSPDAEHP